MVLMICRPDEFVDCDAPVDHVGNATASQELGYGCLKVRFLLYVRSSWEAWLSAVTENHRGIQRDFFFKNSIRITIAGDVQRVQDLVAE